MAESYTTPHSLPVLGTADYVRSPTGDNIRKQINALAVAANNAVTAEGARAEGAAKSYADTKDTTNRTAWAAADTAKLAEAKTYTDGKDATNRTDWAAADTSKLTEAKTYTDTKDTANRSAWVAADTTTLNSAKTYADGQVATDRGRLTSIEAKQAVKAVKLEAGKWVWDLAGATHYLIPDHTGALIARPTPWPVPAATPALDW